MALHFGAECPRDLLIDQHGARKQPDHSFEDRKVAKAFYTGSNFAIFFAQFSAAILGEMHSMNLAELRAALAAKLAEMETLLQKPNTEFKQEDLDKANALNTEATSLRSRIKLLEDTQASIAAAAGGVTSAQTAAQPQQPAAPQSVDAKAAAEARAALTASITQDQGTTTPAAALPNLEERGAKQQNAQAQPKTKERVYRDICAQLNDIKQSMDTTLTYAKREEAINRLTAVREERVASGNTLTDDEGGWAVEGDLVTEIQRLVFLKSPLANAARKLPLSPGKTSITIPYLQDKDRTSSGVEAYWAQEGSTVTKSGNAKVEKLTIHLKKLIAIWDATEELMQNAGIVQNLTLDLIADRMAFKLEDAILNGDGTINPAGILKAAALISVAKETGQEAASFVLENLVKMYARAYGMPQVFYNRELDAVLPFMKLDVGLGGSAVYFPQSAQDGPIQGRLYGMPMTRSEHCSGLGTKGDIALFDMSQYGLLTRGQTRFDSSMHVRFLYDEMTFRFIDEVGGAPLWKTVLTPYKGTQTQSPFVVLDTRA